MSSVAAAAEDVVVLIRSYNRIQGRDCHPMDDNFISIALKNLPKGKTRLSESKNKSFLSDQWEINNDGTFKIETYKTIQQTETLSGKTL